MKELIELVIEIKKVKKIQQNRSLIPPHSLTNFEILKNIIKISLDLMVSIQEKITDGAHVINLDEYSDIETHWAALYVQNNDVTYFDPF